LQGNTWPVITLLHSEIRIYSWLDVCLMCSSVLLNEFWNCDWFHNFCGWNYV